ncbi:hypothetical protein G7077_00380 [Sphingomonas piscis]|uniref:Uncharacterized protein n=1 Tax=Sphingomonas piscis TaxID=2714943 RepID=A0A6G7YLI0_9SPHN|nr:hypothetical protein [Sphingomonas piscis]QIK77603.1 hypothetical protein G7077_00380 [Sphingomonas piscis]
MKETANFSGIAALALSLAMIAAILLIVGGVRLALRKTEGRRGALMVLAGLVLIGNVLVWTI